MASFDLLATTQDVKLRAKEFTSVPDPEVLLALNDAALQINGGVTNSAGITKLMQVYLAAHFLSIRNPRLATPAGPTSEAKVGEVSASYAVSAHPGREDDYNSSRWGAAFLTLRRQQTNIRLLVAGNFYDCPPLPNSIL